MSRKKVDISELDLKKVGGRIAYLRLLKSLNMEDFGTIIGLTKSNISNLEKHKYEPSYKAIVEIIEQFQVNAEWLITGKGEPYIGESGGGSVDGHMIDEDPIIAELLEGARKVLTSGNQVAYDALERNIRYFSHSIDTERRLSDMETRIAQIEGIAKTAKTDRRKGDRRNPGNDQHYDGPERRSGNDRRVSGLGK